MAKLDSIHPEAIELLRGIVDFYNLRGILPVARAYPKKLKPPYTARQSEAWAVFSLAKADMSKISLHMLQQWKKTTTGKRKQWTDEFAGIAMHYWKVKGLFAPIATDYEIIDTGTEYRVKWWIMQDYLDPLTPEVYYTLQTELITKADLVKMGKPIYFTLISDTGERLIAPYIYFTG